MTQHYLSVWLVVNSSVSTARGHSLFHNLNTAFQGQSSFWRSLNEETQDLHSSTLLTTKRNIMSFCAMQSFVFIISAFLLCVAADQKGKFNFNFKIMIFWSSKYTFIVGHYNLVIHKEEMGRNIHRWCTFTRQRLIGRVGVSLALLKIS